VTTAKRCRILPTGYPELTDSWGLYEPSGDGSYQLTIDGFDSPEEARQWAAENGFITSVPAGDKPLLSTWRDAEAELGGVVAVGSRCDCGVNEAQTVLNSPRWGAWDVCHPCGVEQLAVLRGIDADMMARPDLIRRVAVRCIELDRMLSI
jgi:hypothetical protein